MASISASFMGIELISPVLVGACALSKKMENIKQAQDAGAGALVIHSLFQEQIEMEAFDLQEALAVGSDHFAESLTYFPQLEHAGPREHIMWVEKARKAVDFPLVGSLNATSSGKWVEYAHLLEQAGCNGLELNMYAVQADPHMPAAEIEARSLEVIASVKSQVRIPVAVKLSPWYTSVANFAAKAVAAGADGVVMFNRFYQPTIDPKKQAVEVNLEFSRPEDTRLPLRWIAILSGKIKADLVASTGVHSGADVIRHLLAGAKATQSVSSLYLNGCDHIATMNGEISDWMDANGYASIEAFRGRLNQANIQDPSAFERAQYIKLLASGR